MSKVVIVDYGVGNLLSVARAVSALGYDAAIESDHVKIAQADRLILPGVGAFGHCMDEIRKNGLDQVIHRYIDTARPMLGICVGMQVLHSVGYEFGEHRGLNVIEGKVAKIAPEPANLKIPYVGWSEVKENDAYSGVYKGALSGKWFYFVHGYAAETKAEQSTVASYQYGNTMITAATARDNVIGVQFHPEKSAEAGLAFLDRFLKGN